MGYVAVSRAREDATIYTNSIEELRGALDRRVDKEMAVEATNDSDEYARQLHKESTADSFLHYEQPGAERGLEQDSMEIDREQADADNDVAQSEEMEFTLA